MDLPVVIYSPRKSQVHLSPMPSKNTKPKAHKAAKSIHTGDALDIRCIKPLKLNLLLHEVMTSTVQTVRTMSSKSHNRFLVDFFIHDTLFYPTFFYHIIHCRKCEEKTIY